MNEKNNHLLRFAEKICSKFKMFLKRGNIRYKSIDILSSNALDCHAEYPKILLFLYKRKIMSEKGKKNIVNNIEISLHGDMIIGISGVIKL